MRIPLFSEAVRSSHPETRLNAVSNAAQLPIRHAHNKGKKFPPDPLTPHEAQAIIYACPQNKTGIRNRALLTLMYRSGLRVGEALSLRPSSIDFTTHSIRLLYTKNGQAQTRASTQAPMKRSGTG